MPLVPDRIDVWPSAEGNTVLLGISALGKPPLVFQLTDQAATDLACRVIKAARQVKSDPPCPPAQHAKMLDNPLVLPQVTTAGRCNFCGQFLPGVLFVADAVSTDPDVREMQRWLAWLVVGVAA